MRFKGQVLLVTGGASGIGAAVARRFAADGGLVALIDRNEQRAQAVAGELEGAIAIRLDVTDEEAVGRCVDTVAEHFGSIDCLFNAAGHAEFGPIEDWSFERVQRMLTAHVGGTFLFCRQVLPVMRRGSGGAIVNVASVAAVKAQSGNAPYGAAKGAIAAFSRQLARDVAPAIRVNTVAPGRTRTGMTEPLMIARAGSVEQGMVTFGQANLQKRVAEPEEIAAPVCFLLSAEASFITGAVLAVDGGESA